MSTIETYALPEDYDIESEVMKSHQRSYIGNGRILDYMKMYYWVPEEFEQFIYMTHVLQGLGYEDGYRGTSSEYALLYGLSDLADQ